MGRRSAVIVRIRLPAALERVRVCHDPLAARGVPAHVTLLFPFLATDRLEPPVRAGLAGVAATVEPFEVEFRRIRRFPAVLWLAPEPAEPFAALTRRLVRAFPDHRPYEGVHRRIVPHLTIGHGEEAVLDRLAEHVARVPPFAARVRAIEVIAEDVSDRWRLRWRLPVRP